MASGEMTEVEFLSFLSRALGLLERHSKTGSVHIRRIANHQSV
jgi:hypothetical protein